MDPPAHAATEGQEVDVAAAAPGPTVEQLAPGQGAAQASAGRSGCEPAADARTQLLVLGAGPGGYTAASRRRSRLQVTLVDRWADASAVSASMSAAFRPRLCCMWPRSSTRRARWRARREFGTPQLDFARLRGWKNKVVGGSPAGCGPGEAAQARTGARGAAASSARTSWRSSAGGHRSGSASSNASSPRARSRWRCHSSRL